MSKERSPSPPEEASKPQVFPDDTHSPGLLKKLADIREEGDLCDVIFTVKDKSFHAHKVIMAASSDYFMAMFNRGFKETKDKKVKLEGIVPSAFAEIVSFVYTGSVCLGKKTVKNIYEAATMLQYETLQKKCRQFIMDDITPESCIDYLLMAQKHSLTLKKIYKKAKEMLFEHFEDMSKMSQFLDLPFDFMIEMLSSQYLVSREIVILEAICYWIHDHLDLTQDKKDQLLDCLRYGLLGSEGVDCLKKNKDILGKDHPSKIKDRLLHYLLNPTQQPLADPKYHTPRGPVCIVIAGGRNAEDTILETLKIIPIDVESTDKETRELRLPSPRTDTAFVSKGNIAYLIGGKEEDHKGLSSLNFTNSATAKAQRFDLLSQTWTEMFPMSNERYQHAAALVGHTIIVVGGRDKMGKSLSSVERYSIPNNKWEKLQDYPHPVCQAAACEYKGKLFVSGGQDDDGGWFSDFNIYEYGDQGNVWLLKHMMSPSRYSHLMCSREKGLYIIGGRGRSHENRDTIHSDSLVYDPDKEIVTDLSAMPYFLHDISAVYNKGSIYVLGGFGHLVLGGIQDRAVDNLQIYNIKTDTWSEHEIHLPEGGVYASSSSLLTFPHNRIEACKVPAE